MAQSSVCPSCRGLLGQARLDGSPPPSAGQADPQKIIIILNMSPWITSLSRLVFVANAVTHFFTVKMKWLCTNTDQLVGRLKPRSFLCRKRHFPGVQVFSTHTRATLHQKAPVWGFSAFCQSLSFFFPTLCYVQTYGAAAWLCPPMEGFPPVRFSLPSFSVWL